MYYLKQLWKTELQQEQKRRKQTSHDFVSALENFILLFKQHLNSPFPVTMTTTIYYFLLVLLDSLLSSRCLQLLIYVFLLIFKLSFASPNSMMI